MDNRTVIIVNPYAGPKRLISINQSLRKYKGIADISVSGSVEEFRKFINSSLDRYDIFIAAGGDGTVSSLASELAGTGKVLGVFPIGSGNGFAREMGFRKNMKSLIRAINENMSIETDIIYLNDTACINVAGIGIDSFVAHDFQDLNQRGFWKYVFTLIKIFFRLRPFPVSVSSVEKQTEDLYFMVSVANTRQFGNNAFLAPAALPNDGKFDIVLLKPVPGLLLPVFLVRMVTGTLKESKYLHYIVSEGPVEISSPENRYHIDGEPVIFDEKVTVTIKRNALKVLKTRYNRWDKIN